MLHPWLPHAALLLAIGNTAVSIYTFISPIAASHYHGFSLTSTAAATGSNAALAFAPVFGGRNLTLALAMFAFY